MAHAPKQNDQDIVRQAVKDFQNGRVQTADGSEATNEAQAVATRLAEVREEAAARGETNSGHRGGSGTAHAEGRSGSSGSGRSGSAAQRNTNR